jgi:oxygen-independent coproporphyrinogen-3 oxidase
MLNHINPHDIYSLYIHIPFCTSKCSYCAFYSEVISNVVEERKTFGQKIMQELRFIVGNLETPFSTAYIGGGNPGLLPIEDLQGLLDLIGTHGPTGETSIEMNPESLRIEHETLFDHGLDRLSIGIQSMNERHVKTLGRNANISINMRAASIIREFRKSKSFGLNCDLMTCIPGQTIEDAISDIDVVIALFNPNHISLYNLTVEEGTPLADRVDNGTLQVMDEDGQAEMLQACWDHLKSRGFEHYEISNFSRDKAGRSHHNERYWRLENYIGIGPSAAGTLFKSDSQALRTNGVNNLHAYVDKAPFTTYTYEILDERQLMLETLLVALRTREGIDKRVWNRRFSYDFQMLFRDRVSYLSTIDPYLFSDTEVRFSLTEKGFMVLDAIIIHMSEALEICKDTEPT